MSERVRAGGADAFRLRLPGGAAVTEVMSYEVVGGRGGVSVSGGGLRVLAARRTMGHRKAEVICA